MFTNGLDLSIYLRRLLSDQGGKINPVRQLSRGEFDMICKAIEQLFPERLPYRKGYLEYMPGRCSMLTLMAQIDLPEGQQEHRVIPFRHLPDIDSHEKD